MSKFRIPYILDNYNDNEKNNSATCFDDLEYVPLDKILNGYLSGDRSNIRTDLIYDGEDDVTDLKDDLFDVPLVSQRDFDISHIPPVSTLRTISDTVSLFKDEEVGGSSGAVGSETESLKEEEKSE